MSSDGLLVGSLRLYKKQQQRCGICGRKSPWYDRGRGDRFWRSLDFGTFQVFVKADTARVNCRKHGVVATKVPWARHGSRFTKDFEDQAAWLTVKTSRTAVASLLRITWRTVTGIAERIVKYGIEEKDPLEGLHRIGIDEISFKKGHRYITLVYDQDNCKLVWAGSGKSSSTLDIFFNKLGPERCAALTHVSADGAPWINVALDKHCPKAIKCLDPFHVVQWAVRALDLVRSEVWHNAKLKGDRKIAVSLKGARYALWKKPQNLTSHQKTQLSTIKQINEPLYEAYLLKEQLRMVFQQSKKEDGLSLLDEWLEWAQVCELDSFVELARQIKAHHSEIEATLTHKLNNARVESLNTKIRLVIRRAFGFHSPEALISVAMLWCVA
jgi:transposase